MGVQIQVDIAIIISILAMVSSGVSIYSAISTQVRLKKGDLKIDTTKMTEMTMQIDALKETVAGLVSATRANQMDIARRDVEMQGVHRQLSELNGLKIGENFIEIKTVLRHIRELIEGNIKN